ncbi:hypothetical protein FGSG_12163 [Fusarium graminearum PH-1]|uniref:Chromosome 1, complete genome n=1 Tax=Gibberella zeae (strain ATCC MYA-4620 / CBS 123657 / FGSC 9075 / NRRL 31084 / PH-1) TaxID=229533 RepID=I1S5P2_GIBZE|nr:hypothetical protein FGSG_12163 [Fusarium graminearum PH-1]ESU08049.1 hypothetical protein FGSG_12163 [Fusarium graminearum PH-1]CEF74915.1 unnamed protein product [Fusarium graminearum]|eukprot:XP_011318534.1 hypothetical protein FGSG_12163 [Fusarium graminearum PH-1]
MSSSSILCLSLFFLFFFFFFFSFPSSSRLLSAAMTHAIQPPHPSASSSSLSNGACFPMLSPCEGRGEARRSSRRNPSPVRNPAHGRNFRRRRLLTPPTATLSRTRQGGGGIFFLLLFSNWYFCSCPFIACVSMMWPDKRQRVRLTACRHNDGLTPAQAFVIFGIVQPFASKQSSGFNFPVRFVWQLGTKQLDLSTLPVSSKLHADTEY